MTTALVKSEIVLSSTLKGIGRVSEATAALEGIVDGGVLLANPELRAFVVALLADCYTLQGRFCEAGVCAAKAVDIQRPYGVPTVVASVGAIMGESFLLQGRVEEAIAAFRRVSRECEEMGMGSQAIYARLALGEALLVAGREGEARSEILASLPAIEKGRLVPEALSALAILRESLRRRKADPKALRDLIKQLRGGN